MLKRITASLTVASFLFSFIVRDIAAAVIAPAAAPSLRECIDGFVLPSSVGRITGSRDAGFGTVVVNIQDLHCHPEVQRNIARIIGMLDDRYTLDKVYVEGAAGRVDTSLLCGISDRELKRAVIDELVDRGRLTGGEYYSVTANRPGLLAGLENEALYRQNAARLGSILEKQAEYREQIRLIRKELEGIKARYFGTANRRFSKIQRQYAAGGISAERYYLFLKKYTEKINGGSDIFQPPVRIDFGSYRALSAYLDLVERGRQLRYRNISRQLQEFVRQLRLKMPLGAYNALAEKSGNFSRLDELYSALIRISRAYAIDLAARYPDLAAFFDYLERNRAVNPLALISEEKRLSEEIRAGLAEDINEVEVAFLSDFLGYFEDYLTNKLSAEDHAYFTSRFPEFRHLWAKYSAAGRVESLAGGFPLLDAYYAANLERNAAFMAAITSAVRANQPWSSHAASPESGTGDAAMLDRAEKIIVVVAGGFHTSGFSRLLSENNLSCVTITPNVTRNTEAARAVYDELASRQARIFSRQSFALRPVFQTPGGEDWVVWEKVREELITVATALLNVAVRGTGTDIAAAMRQLVSSWHEQPELRAVGELSYAVTEDIVQLTLSPAQKDPVTLSFKIGRGKDGIFLLPRSDTETPQPMFLNRNHGYQVFRDVILESLGGRGGIASGDGDKLGQFKLLYGDPITDFLVETALAVMNEESLKYPGLAMRFGGDESMGWVMSDNSTTLTETFENIRRAIFDRMNRHYGVAELDAGVTNAQLVALMNQDDVPVKTYSRSGSKYLVVFELPEGQTPQSALQTLNNICGLSMSLQDLSYESKDGAKYHTEGYLVVPTYSMGVVRISDILDTLSLEDRSALLSGQGNWREDETRFRYFFGMLQKAADKALFRAKEFRDAIVFGSPRTLRNDGAQAPIQEVYRGDARPDDMEMLRLEKIPQRQSLHRNNDLTEVLEIRVSYGDGAGGALARTYHSLPEAERKGSGRGWSFKSINAMFGHGGGDEVIQLLFSAAWKNIVERFGGYDIVMMRGAPDSIILASRGPSTLPDDDIRTMLEDIQRTFAEYTKLTVAFNVYKANTDQAARSRIFTRYVRERISGKTHVVVRRTHLDECIKSFAEDMEASPEADAPGQGIGFITYDSRKHDGRIADGMTRPEALKAILDVRTQKMLERSLTADLAGAMMNARNGAFATLGTALLGLGIVSLAAASAGWAAALLAFPAASGLAAVLAMRAAGHGVLPDAPLVKSDGLLRLSNGVALRADAATSFLAADIAVGAVKVNPRFFRLLAALPAWLRGALLYASGIAGHETFHLRFAADPGHRGRLRAFIDEALAYGVAQILPAFIGAGIGTALLAAGIVTVPAAAAVAIGGTAAMTAIAGLILAPPQYTEMRSALDSLGDTAALLRPLKPLRMLGDYRVRRAMNRYLRKQMPCWYHAAADMRFEVPGGIVEDVMVQNAVKELPAGLIVTSVPAGVELREGRRQAGTRTVSMERTNVFVSAGGIPCSVWLAAVSERDRSAGVILLQPVGRNRPVVSAEDALAAIIRELQGEAWRYGNRGLGDLVERRLLRGKPGLRPEAVILHGEETLRPGSRLLGAGNREIFLRDAAFILREKAADAKTPTETFSEEGGSPDAVIQETVPAGAAAGIVARAARRKKQAQDMKAMYMILGADASGLKFRDARRLISIMAAAGAVNIRLRGLDAGLRNWRELSAYAHKSGVQLLYDAPVIRTDDAARKNITEHLAAGLTGVELNLESFDDAGALTAWLNRLAEEAPADAIITVRLNPAVRTASERLLSPRLRIVTESGSSVAVTGRENECLMLTDPRRISRIEAALAEVSFENLDGESAAGFVRNMGPALFERCMREFSRLKNALSVSPAAKAWEYDEDGLPELDAGAFAAALRNGDSAAITAFVRSLAADASPQWNDLRQLLKRADGPEAASSYLSTVAGRRLMKARNAAFVRLNDNRLYGDMLFLQAVRGKAAAIDFDAVDQKLSPLEVQTRIAQLLPRARSAGDEADAAIAEIRALIEIFAERKVVVRKDRRFVPSIRGTFAMLGAA